MGDGAATAAAEYGAAYAHATATAPREPAVKVETPTFASVREPTPGAAAATARAARPMLLKQRVEVHGLQARPEFNGRVGIATAFDRNAGRYAVDIGGGNKPLKVREANLRLLA